MKEQDERLYLESVSKSEELKELMRGIEEILPKEAMIQKLIKSKSSKTPLIIKAGFDPTASDLHLGHTVLLQKLKTFQDYGHHVVFLIGDYTARIGDPTGRSEMRPILSIEEILHNAKTYEDQIKKILDLSKTKIVFNSSWLSTMNLADLIQLTSKTTVAQMLAREDFSKRYEQGTSISLVEFLYPLIQAFDSVQLCADVELGGTDQKFNLLMGREIQVAYKQSPQVIMTLPLLVGTDGVQKMSKSYQNYISIQDVPLDIFGKIMSISDDTMWLYYKMLTDMPISDLEHLKKKVTIGETHPKGVKIDLAKFIIRRFHPDILENTVEQEWLKIHRPDNRGIPEDIDEIKICLKDLQNETLGILDMLRLAGLASSNSEARRLISAGSVTQILPKEMKIEETTLLFDCGTFIFRVGKRRFCKIIVN